MYGRVERDVHAALDVAEERDVRVTEPDELGAERGGGESKRAALARAPDADARAIHAGELGGSLDRADGIDVETTVVVGLGARDPPRHDAGMLRPGDPCARVGGVSARPGPAL